MTIGKEAVCQHPTDHSPNYWPVDMFSDDIRLLTSAQIFGRVGERRMVRIDVSLVGNDKVAINIGRNRCRVRPAPKTVVLLCE